jgi:hypothetical protein
MLIHISIIILLLSLGINGAGFAQERPRAKAAPAVAATSGGQAAAPGAAAVRRPNFTMIFGNIANIDTTDPAKPKLEVKSDIDGSVHKVDLTPWTNITKITNISELKTGDTVRIMARRAEDAEVAMTVVFGNIRNVYRPTATRPAAASPAEKAVRK